MRTLIVLGLAGGLLALDGAPEAAAYEGPWCMQGNASRSHVIEICHFATFQACYRESFHWGSASHCVQNPRYLPYWYGRGGEPPKRAVKRKTPRRL